jgi:hypothetical protein
MKKIKQLDDEIRVNQFVELTGGTNHKIEVSFHSHYLNIKIFISPNKISGCTFNGR